MKQPLWILNSTLFLLCIITVFFVYFSRVSLPEKTDIEPVLYSKIKTHKSMDINIAQIYEADLFGTYKAEAPILDKQTLPTLPEPPEPKKIEVPALPKPQFLEPLEVTLKGIFVLSTDSSKNRAIIMNNQTAQESSYKVGDKIADAQLIRIFSNKIILLRSNGQQEVMYVREMDAQLDAQFNMPDEWGKIIKSINETTFLVDPQAFADRVQDLANLIEMLHIITAYRQGRSIGCRIGQAGEKSLALALGLQAGDIVLSIDEIPADTMENRLKIYKTVLSKQFNDTISMRVLRNQDELTFEYILKNFLPDAGQKVTSETEFEIKQLQEEERLKILKQKHEFAPTLEEIKRRERQLMREKGKKTDDS